MKYKLIKELPFENSPKIGYISKPHSSQKDNAHYWNHSWFNPENYPEFWELVVEKNYKILSLARFCSIKPIITDVSDYGDEFIEAMLKCDKARIHSIKRTSDGEIFTIGDKICGHKLEEIYIAPSNKNDLVLSCEGLKRALYLIEDKHLKIDSKSLFTTEDGVDIFPGSSFIRVCKERYILWDKELQINVSENYDKKENWDKRNILHFSTKEAAEEYILLNKPCLSLNDLKQFFPDTYIPFKKGESATEDINTKQLEDLIKQKINNK